jgi:hypothetical protein
MVGALEIAPHGNLPQKVRGGQQWVKIRFMCSLYYEVRVRTYFCTPRVYKVISDRGREAFSEEGRGRASYDAIKTTMMDALGIVPYGNLLM